MKLPNSGRSSRRPTVQRIRFLGGPNWADSDQFDIAAQAANPDATRDEIRTMLQTLLVERFQLVVHRETKEMPVDQTALDGLYDSTFERPTAGSSLFASLDEPGLRLDAKKESVEVLVVDRADHPSPN